MERPPSFTGPSVAGSIGALRVAVEVDEDTDPIDCVVKVDRAAARDGFALLRKQLADVATVLPETEADGLAERMVRDLVAEGHP